MSPMQFSPQPVFLYFDPHPVHEKMANHVGAEFVQCETSGSLPRIKAALNHRFHDRPLLLEGGVPLVEGAIADVLNHCGPLIALAADSTYDDLIEPMEDRSRFSRFAHRGALFFVDGTLAVSERLATLAERFGGGPVRITHPFVPAERHEMLRSIDPNISANRILCLGKYRKKNGQDLLVNALTHLSSDLVVDFVGPDTERIPTSDSVNGHGYVSQKRLLEFFESSSLMVFPAPVGAFPVATLEGLSAGLPVITSPRIGTATLIRGIHGRLIADPKPRDLARAIDWYMELSNSQREALAHRSRQMGTGFTETEGLDAFGFELKRLLADLDYGVTVADD